MQNSAQMNQDLDRRILIAEDELLIAIDLGQRVEAWGWTVLGPVADGLRLLLTSMPPAAILDIKDGLVNPLALELQSRGVPIILSSAHEENNLPMALAGVVNVGKPVSSLRLKAALSHLAPRT